MGYMKTSWLNKTLNFIMGVGLAMIALSNNIGGGIVNWAKAFISIFRRGLLRAGKRLLLKVKPMPQAAQPE